MSNRINKILLVSKILVIAILLFNLFVKLFLYLEIIPYSFNYFSDVMIFILMCNSIIYILYLVKKKQLNKYILIVIIMILISLLISMISAIIGKTPIFLYLWHLRNNYRVFAMMIGCLLFLDIKTIKHIMKYSYLILIIHAILSTYQLFKFFSIYGNFLHQDHINGFFGITKGYNLYSLILILSVTVYYILQYQNNKISKGKLAIVLLLSNWIAAIAELKVFYIYIFILIIILLITSVNKIKVSKTILLCLFITVNTLFSLFTMQFFYPQFKNFFINTDELRKYVFDVSYGAEDEEKIDIDINQDGNNDNIDYTNTKTSIPVVNRFSSFKIIHDHFFTKKLNYIFGIGAGNAEYSQNQLLCSEFYNTHGKINYNRFSLSMILLENGYLGLISYVAVFLSLALIFIHKLFSLRKSKYYPTFIIISLFFAFISIITIVYDSTLRTEASYFYGFLLSFGLPELTKRGDKNERI